MTLEPQSPVNDKIIEAIFFRLPIMQNLCKEFAETKDLNVAQTLLNLMQLYIKNLENAVVHVYHLNENARFADTLRVIDLFLLFLFFSFLFIRTLNKKILDMD